jgi:hypothetical protein
LPALALTLMSSVACIASALRARGVIAAIDVRSITAAVKPLVQVVVQSILKQHLCLHEHEERENCASYAPWQIEDLALPSLLPGPRCSPRSHAGCFEWSSALLSHSALAGLCTTAARTARRCCPMLASLCETVTTSSSAAVRTGPHNASACSSAFATPRRASRPPRYECH